MKRCLWLGFLYCCCAFSAPSPTNINVLTEGPGSVGVVNGGSVNVHVGLTLEDIERVVRAKGQEREKELGDLTARVNALERARRERADEAISEKAVENLLATLLGKRVPHREWVEKLTELAQKYEEMQARLRSVTAADDQTQRLLEKARETNDPQKADEWLEQAVKLELERGESARREAAEFSRQAARMTVCRASLALTRMDRVRAANLLQKAFHDRAGDVDTEAVEWLREAGDILLEIGDNAQAIKLYSQARDHAVLNAKRDPSNPEWQRSTATSSERLGMALTNQGRLEDARVRFEETARISDGLAAAEPTDLARQGDVLRSHWQVADAWLATGQAPNAIEEYETALMTAIRLAATKPSEPIWQRQLLQLSDAVADVREHQGLDASSAIEINNQVLASARSAAKADSSNFEWQWNEAIALGNIAHRKRVKGDDEGAKEAYTDALHIYSELATKYPTEWTWKFFEVVTYENIGADLSQQRQSSAAVIQLRAALQVAQGMVDADPSDVSFQHLLYGVRSRIGGALEAQGDTTAALEEYRIVAALLQHLVALDSANYTWQLARWRNDDRIGSALMSRQSLAEALESYQDGLNVAQEFAQRLPSDEQWQVSFVESLEHVGDNLWTSNDSRGALRMYRAATGLARKFAAAKNNSKYWNCHFALDSFRMGEILKGQRHYIRASWRYGEAINTENRLAEAEPTVTHWQDALYTMLADLGNLYLARHRWSDAVASYRKAAALAQRLIHADPSDEVRVFDAAEVHLAIITLNNGTEEDWAMLSRGMQAADRLEQSGRLTPQRKQWSARFRQQLLAHASGTPLHQSPLAQVSEGL